MSSATTQTTVAHPAPYYVQAPPPAGYPTRDDQNPPAAAHGPVETKSKGDGFWKGCAAALCCCCLLDACF
ncbi:cysteine-rich and transmembrane domain-containing protein WIH1-like [Prunus avium]|uniref:Cysteine-rich and transmembrane domain-containing protein WIH1-like n=1 Tax=Prunus avium TaxID=42229 RepID=A0A6P5RK87_PRUAV|nr:cysteine-rich and transmembrane domain-containing protein WIH1-like [Prunus avium]